MEGGAGKLTIAGTERMRAGAAESPYLLDGSRDVRVPCMHVYRTATRRGGQRYRNVGPSKQCKMGCFVPVRPRQHDAVAGAGTPPALRGSFGKREREVSLHSPPPVLLALSLSRVRAIGGAPHPPSTPPVPSSRAANIGLALPSPGVPGGGRAGAGKRGVSRRRRTFSAELRCVPELGCP